MLSEGQQWRVQVSVNDSGVRCSATTRELLAREDDKDGVPRGIDKSKKIE